MILTAFFVSVGQMLDRVVAAIHDLDAGELLP